MCFDHKCITPHLKDMHILAGITFDPPMNCLPQSQFLKTCIFSAAAPLHLFLSKPFSSCSSPFVSHPFQNVLLSTDNSLSSSFPLSCFTSYIFSLALFHSSLSPLSLHLKRSYFKSWESLAQSPECHGMFWKIRLSAFCKSLAQRTTLPALQPIIPPSKV